MKTLSVNDMLTCIRLLQRAQALIQDDVTKFVCLAVLRSAIGQHERRMARYIEEWILSMLRTHRAEEGFHLYSLDQWMLIVKRKQVTHQELKEIRIQWIDWMIDEIRKELP